MNFDLYTEGLSLVLHVNVLLLLLLGTVAGMVVGAMPGLSPTMAIAVLSPLTFQLDLVPALALLIGVYCGGMYGGSIGAILLNIPGHAGAVITAIEGYPMRLREGPASAPGARRHRVVPGRTVQRRVPGCPRAADRGRGPRVHVRRVLLDRALRAPPRELRGAGEQAEGRSSPASSGSSSASSGPTRSSGSRGSPSAAPSSGTGSRSCRSSSASSGSPACSPRSSGDAREPRSRSWRGLPG